MIVADVTASSEAEVGDVDPRAVPSGVAACRVDFSNRTTGQRVADIDEVGAQRGAQAEGVVEIGFGQKHDGVGVHKQRAAAVGTAEGNVVVKFAVDNRRIQDASRTTLGSRLACQVDAAAGNAGRVVVDGVGVEVDVGSPDGIKSATRPGGGVVADNRRAGNGQVDHIV